MPLNPATARLPRLDRLVTVNLYVGTWRWHGRTNQRFAEPVFEPRRVWAGRRDRTIKRTQFGVLGEPVDIDFTDWILRYGTSMIDGDFITDDEGFSWRVDGFARAGRREFEVFSTREIVFTGDPPVFVGDPSPAPDDGSALGIRFEPREDRPRGGFLPPFPTDPVGGGNSN